MLFRVNAEFYSVHEPVLFKMIHPSYTKEKFKEHNVPYTTMVSLMDKVFGQNPTITNMTTFFEHEAIWDLWNSQYGFRRSQEFKEYMDNLTADQARRVRKHMEKANPNIFERYQLKTITKVFKIRKQKRKRKSAKVNALD